MHVDDTGTRQLQSALVVGGTGFVGRHVVADLLEHGYDVTTLARGEHGVQFGDDVDVAHVTGDRADGSVLRDAARRVEPDLVVDCAAYHPGDVATATDGFADAGAYVYVSSGGVYDAHTIPKREDETPLHDCTPDQADDDTMATYGPRKAECDREATRAAADGVTAFTVRPTMVYGPKMVPSLAATEPVEDDASGTVAATWSGGVDGLQTHHDYWVDRVASHDRVVVPGDGTAIWHRAYVEDVASAVRVVAEYGTPGEAYNVGDRRVCTMEDVVGLVADALETSVTVVHASERELAAVGLEADDFVLYHHIGSQYPHVLETCKLAALGWTSTPVEDAMERTVEESAESGRDGSFFDPGREAEAELLDRLA